MHHSGVKVGYSSMQVVDGKMGSEKVVWILLILTVICTFMYMSRPSAPEAKLVVEHAKERYDGGGVRWRNVTQGDPTKERVNIFFLKTHKCGSSTVQNILMRFGYARHLDFVLPVRGNYLGFSTYRFHPNCVAKVIMEPNRTFNIFAHHSRFDYEKVKEVMKPDAAFVTIFREPSYVFEALYYYYDFVRPMKMDLKELVRSPETWSRLKQRGARLIYGTNQISWDLGFNTTNFDGMPINTSKMHEVKRFIQNIDKEFDLVMIMEYMEASLVLLCDLMNWPLEHVVHLQLNKREHVRVTKLNPSERYMLLKMNPLDSQLYDHFLTKFQGLVRDYGADKMKCQVEKLLNLNSDLKRMCRFSTNYEGFRRTVKYVAQNATDPLCHYVSLNELEFTEMVRNDQFKRFTVLRQLDALVAEQDYSDLTTNSDEPPREPYPTMSLKTAV